MAANQKEDAPLNWKTAIPDQPVGGDFNGQQDAKPAVFRRWGSVLATMGITTLWTRGWPCALNIGESSSTVVLSNDGETLFRLAWIISLPVRRPPVIRTARRRYLAWLVPDSLSIFRLLGGESELRASLSRVTNRRQHRYYADEKNVPIFLLRLLLLLSAAVACRLPPRRREAALCWARPGDLSAGSKQTPLITLLPAMFFNSVMGRQCRWFTLDGFYHHAASLVIHSLKRKYITYYVCRPSLPTDRESAFYLNSKSDTPSVDTIKNKLTGQLPVNCDAKRD